MKIERKGMNSLIKLSLKTHARSQHERVVRRKARRVTRDEHDFTIEHVTKFDVAADHRLCFPFQAADHADVVVVDLVVRCLPGPGPRVAAGFASTVAIPFRVADCSKEFAYLRIREYGVDVPVGS